MQLAVLLRGRLKGMGLEAPCELMARRDLGDKRVAYSGMRLIDAPGSFPDGDYVVVLESRRVAVRRRNGEWLMGSELLTEPCISASKNPLVT